MLLNKGYEHLQNPQAFVMHIAKKKLAKYYGFKSRFISCMSLFSFNNEDDEEFEAPISDNGELSLEDKCEAKQLYFQLCQHLKSKDPATQKIFLLYYSLDMPLKQIAAELKISEGTVKNKLYRAVNELKTIYGKDGDKNDRA